MKRSVQEILDMPEFNLFFNPQEVLFFILKRRDAIQIINEISDLISQKSMESMDPEKRDKEIESYKHRVTENATFGLKIEDKLEKINSIMEFIKQSGSSASQEEIKAKNAEYDRLAKELDEMIAQSDLQSKQIKEAGLRLTDSDAYATHMNAEASREVLSRNTKKISGDSYVLFQAMLAKKYYEWLMKAESGKHVGHDEFCFASGLIVSIDDNEVKTNARHGEIKIAEVKDMLIETMCKANQIMQQTPAYKNKPLSISGMYISRGVASFGKSEPEGITSKSLADFLKSPSFIASLDPYKLSDYVQKGYIKRNDLIRVLKKSSLPENMIVEILSKGLVSEREVFKVLGISSYADLVKRRNYSLESGLVLYSSGKLSIQELEKLFKDKEDVQMPSERFWKRISEYYRGNINKISELITHNVIDYTSSMEFLDYLEFDFAVTNKQRSYLESIMNDFKDDELVNIVPNGLRTGGGSRVKYKHVPNLTIDPEMRKSYLRSVGDVKELRIKGSPLLKDDSAGVTKKNSLDGYQLVILPDKKVAILEKFYEVERDKDDNIVYKRDKEGNLIPAIENATYIIPIGMARDFATRKNKQQLMHSRFVRRAAHTLNWVENVESKIKEINPEAKFNKENTAKWAKKISDNYKKLKESR